MTHLRSLLQTRLQQGAIPFTEFMQSCLYDPHWGYYSSGLQKFGLGGDFITAPELSPLFGATLAHQCLPILQNLSQPILFEFGAGQGRLCVDLLKELQTLKALPSAYHILEISADLRHRQQQRIQAELPEYYSKVVWHSQWPEQPFEGIIIANEVLDAMPVARFKQVDGQILESYVGLDANQHPIETFQLCTNPHLLEHVQKVLPKSQDPYLSEANLFLEGWIAGCSNMLQRGAAFIFDYGFPRREYYHPDRKEGTLMCHYQHKAHPNPFIHLGEQDITAHVDFTHLAEAADAAGFRVAGFTHQAAFLLSNGILQLLEAMPEGKLRHQETQAVKQLLQPNEMGELFKVMALTRDLEVELKGFALLDKRGSL